MLSTKVADLLNAMVARLPDSAGKYVTLVFRMVRAVAVGNISDRAMTLAGQAFTSILPVILLLTTLPGAGVVNRAVGMFDFSEELGQDPTSGTYASFGALGALMTLISATSLARALDRMYMGVWGVRSAGLRGWWRWFVVIGVLAIATVAQAALFAATGDDVTGIVANAVGAFVIWTLAWTAVPRVLAARQLGGADLGWIGLVCGTAVAVLVVVTPLGYTPVFASARDSFGALGVVFASIGWLFVYAAIVVTATVLVRVVRTPPEVDVGEFVTDPDQLSG